MSTLATDPDPSAGRPVPPRLRASSPSPDPSVPTAPSAPTSRALGSTSPRIIGDAAAPPAAGPAAPPPARRVRDMSTLELGRAGEDLAAEHLSACGWQIVDRNLRLRQGELDIVALAHTTLVFVEVKTRRSFVTGVPQAAVTPDKLRRLRRLAGEYLMERSTPHRDVRIDVIGIHAHLDGTFSLEHLEAVS